MSEGKWTPGPWRVEDGTTLVWAKDACGFNGVPVAKCDTAYRSWGRQIPLDEHDANARLIAAAPELYEALKQARAWIAATEVDDAYDVEGPDIQSELLDRIDATLLKASGGSDV